MLNQLARYEKEFANWRQDGYPRVKPETYRYIEYLTDQQDDQSPREGILWQHQWEAFLRVIYTYEILNKEQIGSSGLLLNIVTGGGKTALIAAIIAWLRVAHHTHKFLILCPNLIVRDRLEVDFQSGKVFHDRKLIPDWSECQPGDFILSSLGSDRSGGGWANLFSSNIILGNIHQFYQSNRSGQSNLSALMNGPEFALFNDEAHNSPAPEWENTLKKLACRTLLRTDLTATPQRADGQTPDSSLIYEYTVHDALADGLVKSLVVYQPSIQAVELTYTDVRTGEKRKVEEIDWDEVDRLGLSATQWVTDDEPMRQQIAISLKRLEEQEGRAKGRYQPILFVVAVCKADAEKAAQTLNLYFKLKTLLVTEDSDEEDRRQAHELGRAQKSGNPYKAVVSVLMLREGWDVPEVGVILLLRKFSSKVYGQQVIGRGLRRVRVENVQSNEPQICAIVDHPKLEHQWLWDIFNAKKRVDVSIDDQFDEIEDLPSPLPKQELRKPEMVIAVPEINPNYVDEGEFVINSSPNGVLPRQDWRQVLNAIVYEPNFAEITRVDITEVVGTELSGDKWKTRYSSPEIRERGEVYSVPLSNEALRESVKSRLLEMAEEMLDEAGYAPIEFKSRMYSVLMSHVRAKFLKSNPLGLAEREDIEFVWKILPQIKEKLRAIPGLIGGIIEYGD
ncbi:MAG: DEAD/DEAH box helicase family protein [Fimbriimonadia bacterium]|nr:DEAD/DEAH box helicase family protein [Fimbriimonadia bacterium]